MAWVAGPHRRGDPRRCRGLAGLVVILLASPAIGGVSVRLPTEGYVRAGRYFPVEVSSSVLLRADGCLPCEVASAVRSTVPMLAISGPGVLTWDGGTIPLRVPGDHERLVGSTSAVPAELSTAWLFPGERIIPIRLDPADPLPGPAAAWEVLDAVVLDPAAMAALGEGRRSTLLAGGVTLAVTGDVAPAGRWRRQGALWALSYAPAGPTGVVAEAAYGPTEAWTPGWPAAVRQAAAGAGVVICIVTIASLLIWRRRPWLAALLGVTVPLAAAGGIVVWRSQLDPVAYGGGDVTVVGGGWRQRDTWVYERARMDADVVVPWKGWTHPVFASDEAVEASRARLTVGADGQLAFAMRLAAGNAMAFLRREVGTGEVPTVSGERGAAMRGIAPLYRSQGDRVVGETPPTPGRWAGVAIARP